MDEKKKLEEEKKDKEFFWKMVLLDVLLFLAAFLLGVSVGYCSGVVIVLNRSFVSILLDNAGWLLEVLAK